GAVREPRRAQDLPRDLRVRLPVEGARRDGPGGAEHFQEGAMERAARRTVRAEQRAVDVEQDQASHAVLPRQAGAWSGVTRVLVARPPGVPGARLVSSPPLVAGRARRARPDQSRGPGPASKFPAGASGAGSVASSPSPATVPLSGTRRATSTTASPRLK